MEEACDVDREYEGGDTVSFKDYNEEREMNREISPVIFEKKESERKDTYDISTLNISLLGVDEIKSMFKLMIVREMLQYINGYRKLDIGFFKIYDRAMEILEKDGEEDISSVCASAKEMFGKIVK